MVGGNGTDVEAMVISIFLPPASVQDERPLHVRSEFFYHLHEVLKRLFLLVCNIRRSRFDILRTRSW